MRVLKLRDGNLLVLAFAFSALAVLPGCNVNVRKDSEGQGKKVDIETPIGGLHVSKAADVRDTGLPVYPGARLKERNKDKNKDDDDDSNSANVNISSSLFGLRVVAIEYLSDDSPEKLIAYYTDKLKKYGSVLECHTNKSHGGATIDSSDDSKESQQLKCEGDDRNGKIVELKAGTRQSQHIVSIKPADAGKGSDFGLVFVQVRGGKDTI
jgi:hypothetical protein